MFKETLVAALLLIVATAAEEPSNQQTPQGRQLNWNGLNYMTKPGYLSNGADLDGAASMMPGQGKSSSNFQSHSPQSLDGSDINRDGSYSAPATGGDYGYEASPDSSYSSGTSYGSSYGYGFNQFPPTTSRPFYSRGPQQALPQSVGGMAVPNSFLRGVPRDQLDRPGSSYPSAGLQSGSLPNYFHSSGGYWNNTNSDQMANRAGYDEDIPLGGISSSTSSSGLLSGTTMRNSLSRQDDYGYGSLNGFGYGSIPPAGGFGSPGYSSNYAAGPYSSSYGSPAYSPYYGSNYRNPLYSSYGGSPAYSSSYNGLSGYSSYGSGYSSYGSPAYNSYNSYGSYRNPYYSNLYGEGAYGGGYGAYPYYKKQKKSFWNPWGIFKAKEVEPYVYAGNYGNTGYNYAVPYDYYYDAPSLWQLSKFAFKSMMKSMFKPFFKWLPFCSPFYYDRDDRAWASQLCRSQ